MADGLAGWKGSSCRNKAAAKRALVAMMEDQQFGASGQTVVIEEFLQGEEFSNGLFLMRKVYPMVIAQDHKRIFDGDAGPNTGDGCLHVPQIPEAVQQAISQVLKPTAKGMVAEKRPFQGILYAGLIKRNWYRLLNLMLDLGIQKQLCWHV